MIAASVGTALASDLTSFAFASDSGDERLDFGARQPLVDLLQQLSPEKMLPAVVEKIRSGVALSDLVAAAALANASAFGGEDYIGFHTLMALKPTLDLADYMHDARKALPVLKVLYRNSARLADTHAADNPALRPVAAGEFPSSDSGENLRQLVRDRQRDQAESAFAAAAKRSPETLLSDCLSVVEDGAEVHRVVLVHRSWDMVSLVGAEQAHALLRQSLRYCLKNEEHTSKYFTEIRSMLPKTLDQHKLIGRTVGIKTMDDETLDKFVEMLFTSTPSQAADAVGAALAEGFAPDAIGEAVSLAANQLVLRDVGRQGGQIQPGKPAGSVHGDSIGVHASDSANAWRNIARYGGDRHSMIATILSAYQVALDRTQRGGDFANWKARPTAEALAAVDSRDPEHKKCHGLGEIQKAIRANEQELACAATFRYLEAGHAVGNLFSTFAGFATSEDGALHAEKYFHTVREEYNTSRPAFRNRHLIALARVTASEFGKEAPGYEEACGHLNVENDRRE
jgi:hypothetical protein